MGHTDIQFIWFLVIGVLFAVYAILDGFDLGVGIWHLFARKEEDRQILLNTIGPVWDGNEVWLIAGGGSLLAAFPLAYATVFSSMYLAVMALIWALIFRGISIEFRGQLESRRWRSIWDIAFAIASFLPALLLGVALGNILHGISLDETQNYDGTFLDLFNPYALLIGLFGVTMFATHGAAFIVLRTEKELNENAKKWLIGAWIAYLVLFLAVSIFTIADQSQLLDNYEDNPLLWVVPLVGLVAIIMIGYFSWKDMDLLAFSSSAISVAVLMLLTGISLYPNLVPALESGRHISIELAASSEKTLQAMLVIALIGMPLVLIYTGWIYRTLMLNKVKLGPDSY
ncbi:MAG: cytochrome d ubiquinol oxidase subunit II [Candidatus Hodarchaeales archaeon]|jgi:cytochrome d ubiquinol oxidase subunit II